MGTTGEVLVICGFHLVGLAFEMVEVPLGSWAYPESAWTKVLGVPLYSGFLYAAVGSYVVAAWRLVDPAKFGAWAMLVSVTFVLVAAYRARAGRLFEPTGGRAVPMT